MRIVTNVMMYDCQPVRKVATFLHVSKLSICALKVPKTQVDNQRQNLKCDDQGGGGVVEAKIRVETRRALTCDDQTVGSVAHACTDTRGDKLITT